MTRFLHFAVIALVASAREADCDASDAPVVANVQLQAGHLSQQGAVVLGEPSHADVLAMIADNITAASFSAIQEFSDRARLHSAARTLGSLSLGLNESWDASVTELQGVMGHLGDKMSDSEDSCASNLISYKKKLKAVHRSVTTIVTEVRASESGMHVYSNECAEKKDEVVHISKVKKKRITTCHKKMIVQKETFRVLKKDLREMKTVAKSRFGVSQSGNFNKYANSGYRPQGSYVEQAAARQPVKAALIAVHLEEDPDESEAESVHSMVQQTQQVASKLQACLAEHGQPHHDHALLEELAEDGVDSSDADLVAFAVIASAARYVPPSTSTLVGVNDSSGTWPSSSCPLAKPKCFPVSCVDDNWVCGVAESCAGSSMGDRCTLSQSKRAGVCVGNLDLRCVPRARPAGPCGEVVVELEHTYSKSYRSLTRLVEEYRTVTHSHVCKTSVVQQYQQELGAVEGSANKACKRERHSALELTKYKAQYVQMVKTEKRVRKSLKIVQKQCGRLSKTEKYVHVVKSTLKALGRCPGIGNLHFSLPRWVGAWTYFKQKKKHSDKWNDRAMLRACRDAFGNGSRPAEISEIDSQTIRRMPKKNTGDAPVLGVCPMCEGKKNGELSKEGHGRKCWDAGAKFNTKQRRNDCNSGRRAIMCIADRPAKAPFKPQVRR